MKKLTFLVIALMFSVLLNAQTKGQTTSSITWSNFAGSQTRAMTIYVPDDYNASNAYKLIIGFHGLGDTDANYIGALIPYCTDSYYGNVIAVSLQYSDWDENLHDDGIVPNTIDHISATYNIDAENIYLQGFSVGGISSTYRGLKNSSLIKGIITNSGAIVGIPDVENSCTCTACKEYDYSKSNEVFACFTSSPDGESGSCSGASSACGVTCNSSNTFYVTNIAAADEFNSYTSGSGLFLDNPNNCHCLPTVTVNHQCWDHVSQIVSTTTPVANFNANPTTIGEGQSVTFTDNSVEGGAPISNWSWTFTNGNPATFIGSNPPAITYSTVGTHEVSLTVTNSYGNDTEARAGYITVLPNGDLFSLDFELPSDYSQFFPPWSNIDLDGMNTYSSSDFDFTGEGSAFGFMAMNPADAAVSTPIATTHGGDRCGMAICPSDASASNNWLISDRIYVGTGANFNFWTLSPKTSSWGTETYNVLVSTTDNNTTSFSAIATGEDAPSSWTQKTYSLSSYTGQYIYVAIQHVSADKFMFWVDDIEITGATTENNIIENKNIIIFPNPTNGKITISNAENSNIEISDINGRVILSVFANTDNITLDMSILDKGTYIAKIINDSNISIKKIIVE